MNEELQKEILREYDKFYENCTGWKKGEDPIGEDIKSFLLSSLNRAYKAGKEEGFTEGLKHVDRDFDTFIQGKLDKAEQQGYQKALKELVKEWPGEKALPKLKGTALSVIRKRGESDGFNEMNRTGLDLIKSKLKKV